MSSPSSLDLFSVDHWISKHSPADPGENGAWGIVESHGALLEIPDEHLPSIPKTVTDLLDYELPPECSPTTSILAIPLSSQSPSQIIPSPSSIPLPSQPHLKSLTQNFGQRASMGAALSCIQLRALSSFLCGFSYTGMEFGICSMQSTSGYQPSHGYRH